MCTLDPVLSTMHLRSCSIHCAPWILHYPLCTLDPALSRMHLGSCSIHCASLILHYPLYTLDPALSAVHLRSCTTDQTDCTDVHADLCSPGKHVGWKVASPVVAHIYISNQKIKYGNIGVYLKAKMHTHMKRFKQILLCLNSACIKGSLGVRNSPKLPWDFQKSVPGSLGLPSFKISDHYKKNLERICMLFSLKMAVLLHKIVFKNMEIKCLEVRIGLIVVLFFFFFS